MLQPTPHTQTIAPPGGRNRQKMVTATKSSPSKRFIQVISFPCGLARQFRVQVLSDSGAGWQKYATFHQADAAEACAEKLDNLGITARVVHYKAVPICG